LSVPCLWYDKGCLKGTIHTGTFTAILATVAFLVGLQSAWTQQGEPTPRKMVVQETLIAREEFANRGAGWDEADTETYAQRIENGRYLIIRRVADGRISTWNRFAVDPDSSFFIECAIEKLSEGDEGAYGLIWGFEKPDSSFVFMLSPRGYYLYGKWVDGNLNRLIDWTASGLVHRDGKRNLLAVKRYRERLEFFVNHRLVAEAPFEPLRGANIGFQAWNLISVAIDDLSVGRYEMNFVPPLEEEDFQIAGPEAMLASPLELRMPPEHAYLFDHRYAAEHFSLMAAKLQKNRSYEKAAAAYRSAIQAEEMTAAPSKERLLAWNGWVGNAYSRLGNLEQTRAWDARALEIARELGRKPEISLWLANLGYALERLNKKEEALKLYQESLALEQELNRGDMAADRLLSISGIHYALKRLPEALDSNRRACLLLEEAGKKVELSRALVSFGGTLAALNRNEEAAEQFRRAQL
jgi:tetratricopeptide (TPR) repeat protein